MNKGFSLIETLTVILLISILLVITFSLIRTGNFVFTKGFQNFLIHNDYDDLIKIFLKDFNNLKELKAVNKYKILLQLKNNIKAEYEIIKKNDKVSIFRNEKKIKLKKIIFKDVYIEGYNKKEQKSTDVKKIVLIKIFINYPDHNNMVLYNFELFDVKR